MDDTEQKDLAHAINQASRTITNLLNDELGNYGIYASQYQLLVNIQRYHGENSQSLAQILHVKPAAISRTLRKIEQKGLITRRRATDQRAYQIIVTKKGQHLLNTLADRDSRIFEKIFDNLSVLESRALLQVMKKLNKRN